MDALPKTLIEFLPTEEVEHELILEKVISGGQTGADYAGLAAAKECGFETGGWMPLGFKTLRGPRPDYQKTFGIQEDTKSDYASRTAKNVRDSDGTIRFATDFKSPGEICTLKAINKLRKPYLDIPLPYQDEDVSKIISFILENDIRTLNVAGNADRGQSAYHFRLTYSLLKSALQEIKKIQSENSCTSK